MEGYLGGETPPSSSFLRNQVQKAPLILLTINRMLEKDVGLGEQIKTLFRELDVTIVSILAAISLAISTIFASIIASVRPIPTPTPPAPPPSGGGVKDWIQKSIKLTKETSIELVIDEPF